MSSLYSIKNLGLRLPLISLAASLLVPRSYGQPPLSVGAEFQVNSAGTSYQSAASVSVNPSTGGFVVVWTSGESSGTDNDASSEQARIYDIVGAPQSEFQVNTYTQGQQGFVSDVAHLDSGAFMVVWQSGSSPDTLFGAIHGRSFQSDGTPITDDLVVSSFSTGPIQSPSIGKLSDDEYIVVWRNDFPQDSDAAGLFGQIVDVGGTKVGGEFQINSITTGEQTQPRVAGANGGFVVAWASEALDGDGYGIAVRLFDSVGLPLDSEVLVNEITTGDQVKPAVQGLPNGQYLVVWEDRSGSDGSIAGISERILDVNGNPVGMELVVNTTTASAQREPAIDLEDIGSSAVVTWNSFGQDGSDWAIVGQRISFDGSRLGEEFQVNTYTTERQYGSTVGSDGLGNFVVVWESRNQDGDSFGVFGQRFASSIFADGFESGDTSAWSSTIP